MAENGGAYSGMLKNLNKSLVACVIIKPASNGFFVRTVREDGRHEDLIIWSTKALFFALADMVGFDLSKQDFTYTHNGEKATEQPFTPKERM